MRSIELADVNAEVSGLLRDLASVQTSRPKAFGYKRAAAAVFHLDEPLTAIWSDGGLSQRVPGIGRATTGIIGEVLQSGRSEVVEMAIEASGKRLEVDQRRRLRSHFLSRSAVIKVLRNSSLGGPGPQDYRGDLQMHTEWSDGSSSVADMADACLARGYRYAAMTDHSHGLRVAAGMSMADAAAQANEIDRVNGERQGSFRVLRGIEANITADGSLDLSPEEARTFELVLAAPHSKLRTNDDQTGRLLVAIERPEVRILAHPRGRRVDSRPGITADWERVFDRAARLGVALEIDGDPSRQDLDFTLAARARDAGCIFALDSDAHDPDELSYSETALAHARLAGISARRIVNFWDLDQVLEWLTDRRAVRAA
jgi:putative hydrolase